MNLTQFKEFCENTPLVAHNAKFENTWLLDRGIDANIVDDTMLLAYLYDERLPLDLESLVLKFGVDKPFKEEYGHDVGSLEGVRLQERNVTDARNTIELRDILKSKLSEKELFVYHKVLLPATKTLAQIELEGVCVDKEGVHNLLKELDDRFDAVNLRADKEVRAFEEATSNEFNINSPVHKGILIYDLLGYKPLKFKQAETDSGNPSTNKKVLEKLVLRKDTETLRKIIQCTSLRGYKKWYKNLVKECDKCGRTHIVDIGGKSFILPNLHIANTNTGRINSSHPNMLNSPSREGGWTRKVFPSRHKEGYILEFDYDQIELRLLAGISQDERLLDEFARGLDPHVEMAKLAFNLKDVSGEQRDRGKTLNYAIPFGRGSGGIAFDTGTNYKEAKGWLNRYWEAHPQLRDYLDNIPESGVVISPTGMKRHCTTWTQGKNFGIQNSALIVLLTALNRTAAEAKRLGAPMDLPIHDSIRMDVTDAHVLKKSIPQVKELLEFKAGEIYPWLPIPLTTGAKYGHTWGEMKKYA